ncbi:MAG: hypothetical protein JOZ90_16105 [Alphaproteobacteria bacterium]|nr:hypothetical protein [Alphaproteobacteria bacterium]MBV9373361.1 hypothetical protein [Alphaproteobacteria bacterium]MBV9902598.1 hypothetical protein [Alphaproteobacteria bacterium]
MSLRSHFQKHGIVHSVWLFSILLLTIAALLLEVPNGVIIRDYISFAASIASLILALVAIFYSFIANQGFSGSIEGLSRSSVDLQSAAKNINDTSAALSEQSERLMTEFSVLRPAVQGIAKRMESLSPLAEGPAPESKAGHLPITAMGSEEAEFSAAVSKPRGIGATMTLYMIARSAQTGKKIDLRVIAGAQPIWEYYCSGFLDSIYQFSPFGIELSRTPEEDAATYVVHSLGIGDISELFSAVGMSVNKEMATIKAAIDDYFFPPGESSSGDDKPNSD